MSTENQGSNQEGSTQGTPAASPTAENQPGAPVNQGATIGEKPQTRNVPPASFFVDKRKTEKRNQELEATVARMERQLNEMNAKQQSAPAYEGEYSQQPPAASRPTPNADDIDQRFRAFEQGIHKSAREMSANQWLSNQKHVEDPRFAEALRQQVQIIRETEAGYGYQSDPILVAKNAYDEVAASFGVKSSGELTNDLKASAGRSNSQVAPSAGAGAGGSTASQDYVSLKDIAAKQHEALRNRDGAAYEALTAMREKARSSGRLKP